jgi:hypothetical protein
MSRALARTLLALVAGGCGGARALVTDCVDEAQSWDIAGSEPLTTFHAATSGAGRFGRWVVGPSGLPEYAYTLDELHDPAAAWPVSDERPSTSSIARSSTATSASCSARPRPS